MKSSRWIVAVLVAALALAPGVVLADDCDHSADREARLEAEGAKRLRVIARAGSLEIQGRAGVAAVEVSGRACASSPDQLEEIRIATSRSGDVLTVRAEIPEPSFGWRSYARLDLSLEVPSGIHLEVDDSSGSAVIRDVASLEIEDSSGGLEIERIGGDVEISDSSGSISVNVVEGNVRVREDGSGSMTLTDVRGDVEIEEDGSGSISVRRVRGSVYVGEDGSGSISVADISGDLTVDDDGSGGIYVEDVGGEVRIPD